VDKAGGYQDLPFVAEFYDAAYDPLGRNDIEFYTELAKKSDGPVLELACGTGRVLIPTARAGIDIVGIDLSERMLERCRANLAKEPKEVSVRVDLHRADMCDFDLGRKFKLVTMPFRPFMHIISIDDQFRCLECVRRHLADDGTFAFDIFFPNMKFLVDLADGRESGDEPERVMPDGRRFLRRFRFEKVDPISQVNICEIIFYVTHPDGKKERLVHRFPMRYTWRYEAEHLLKATGLVIMQVYGDFDWHPLSEDHQAEQIFVCRRRR